MLLGDHKNSESKKHKSTGSKLKSEQNSEKFSMLRNIVENIDDPEKRKILLNFLDQSSLKTEYVTIKESSSSGENPKGMHKVPLPPKKRRKSPNSTVGHNLLYRGPEKYVSSSQKRKRFSLAYCKNEPETSPNGYQFHNFKIERQHATDGCGSKNGDPCHTEESREVPLEFILGRMDNQQPVLKLKSRQQSGYSASQEKTQPGPHDIAFDNFNFDIEANLGLDTKPNEKVDISADEMVKIKIMKSWAKWFKSIIIMSLVLALVIVTTRGIFLEIRHQSDSYKMGQMGDEISSLYSTNEEWEQKYNE